MNKYHYFTWIIDFNLFGDNGFHSRGYLFKYNDLWNKTKLLNNDIINKYSLILDYAIEKWDMDYFNLEIEGIKLNSMQRKALKELRRNRDMGVNKALLISATGSWEPTIHCYY